ncbi:Type II secretory pathway, ATPase PulE/Tfp pilus assembly pathway, ATPase PilB [hydrothermal vent metagenome]|uniref:Type II secretory pathway, ATPase PulE/Tfp pilus assembly pathway, ATPase PilB n=1 Tax=hydrothermal vent metagenome TaxID=652676 RepID=A0A3B1BGZ2_9ZZZZ
MNIQDGIDHKLEVMDILPWLVADGLLAQKEADDIKCLYESVGNSTVDIHPLTWLAGRHLKSSASPYHELNIERLTEWLAGHVGLPYLRIDPLKIDVDSVGDIVSKAYASRFKILPVSVDDKVAVFATAEPFKREWEQELNHALGREIERVVANPLDIARYMDEFFGLTQSMRRAKKADSGFGTSIDAVEALVELGRAGKLDANDRHIVSIVDWLLQYAFDQRASDIHLEPRRENANIRFRIDGLLNTVYEMPTTIMIAVVSRIKSLGRMDVVDKRRPQDGRVKTKTPSGQEVELRLSTMPTAFGEKMVMRIFDPQVLVRNLTELGFSKSDARHWQEMTSRTHGIILVTGPTGSGKTTTLYSTLKQLAQPEINLCTIEDPIEMIEPAFNQMQVLPAIGLDFASGVRTLLRQDPDIVMIGEIRDLETAQMAIQAALTGHLVLSTLHTNDASSAITRLMDIGVAPYLIRSTVIGVVAQRLLRTLCPHCKIEVKDRADAWAELTRPWKMALPSKVYHTEGCDECRKTGYSGRMGIYEILRMTREVRSLIDDDCTIEKIRKQGLKQGMEPLRISGVRKVNAGHTSIEEVMRVAPPADEF